MGSNPTAVPLYAHFVQWKGHKTTNLEMWFRLLQWVPLHILGRLKREMTDRRICSMQYWCSMVSISAFQADGEGSSPLYCSIHTLLTFIKKYNIIFIES